jgi:signal transduction histidine kinase
VDLRKRLFKDGDSIDLKDPRRLWDQFIKRFFRLQYKLIIPYVILSLITAMLGVFIITRLVSSSFKERFSNQLNEAGRVAADGIVRHERTHLEELRLLAFMDGVSDAFSNREWETLLQNFKALGVNNKIEAISAIDTHGREILTFTLDLETGDTASFRGGTDFSNFGPIEKILQGDSDELGDKYSAVIEASDGYYLFTGGPVRGEDDALVGALLVGTRLETLVRDIKLQSLSDIVALDLDGNIVLTTLPESDEGYGAIELGEDELTTTLETSLNREFEMFGRDYTALYAPLVVRHEDVGILAVALPSDFIVSTLATSRNNFTGIFTLGTVAVIALGYILAQHIALPILRLRKMTTAVASGDLEQESGVDRSDEIGDLAKAFDTMTLSLRDRTEEAAQLYAEAIQRNMDLADANARLQSTQAQLIQSEKLASVGQLTAGIVHDVKNPLAVIKGLAEELTEEVDSDGFAREGLETIRDSASKANTIVSDLLKFARQSTPDMQRRDMRETIRSVIRLTEYLARKGNVEVTTEMPETVVLVTYDAQQIEQVLINMTTNAVQAMPEGGTLEFALKEFEESVEINISDSGSGIPESNLDRIFDPFFTTKPEGEGTGLGLSVSYGIIARHGGQIDVESTMGEGTTFTVYLPALPQEPEEKEEERMEVKEQHVQSARS